MSLSKIEKMIIQNESLKNKSEKSHESLCAFQDKIKQLEKEIEVYKKRIEDRVTINPPQLVQNKISIPGLNLNKLKLSSNENTQFIDESEKSNKLAVLVEENRKLKQLLE